MKAETLAFSPELVRQEMLRGLRVPDELANAAFRTLAKKLTAKTTKFFAHEGEVISERDVDDNDAQLRATDQVFTLTGLYAPRAQPSAPSLGFALEIDPRSGVIRIVASQNQRSVTSPQPRALTERVRADKATDPHPLGSKPAQRKSKSSKGVPPRNQAKPVSVASLPPAVPDSGVTES